jgi:hypothetical protein
MLRGGSFMNSRPVKSLKISYKDSKYYLCPGYVWSERTRELWLGFARTILASPRRVPTRTTFCRDVNTILLTFAFAKWRFVLRVTLAFDAKQMFK